MSITLQPLRINALTPDEIAELDRFLMSEATPPDTMMIDTLDGFLTAIVIGPAVIKPARWMPMVWGARGGAEPDFSDTDEALRIKSLIIRHLNGITLNFLRHPNKFEPLFSVATYGESEEEFIDGEMWAYGFMKGMALAKEAWKPLITTVEGEQWLRPLYLLAMGKNESADAIAQREQKQVLSVSLPVSLQKIHAFCAPLRDMQDEDVISGKQGRNDPCACGSGKKFKKCCGSVVLH